MMNPLVTTSKVQKIIEAELLKKLPELYSNLWRGDLLNYEQSLSFSLQSIYNKISEMLLAACSKDLMPSLKIQAKAEGLKRLRKRPLSIQLGTGYVVKVKDWYANDIPDGYSLPRHVLAGYWKLYDNSSIPHLDKVCMSSILCPSYSVANQLLMRFGVRQSISRIRKLTNEVASHCQEIEVELSLSQGENLTGKRVVIGIDGGRVRTRKYTGQKNEAGHAVYETPWREPKLFVIHVLDEEGKLDKDMRPIYGCRFSEEAMMALLKSYLIALRIASCEQVQLLADGAPWIWNTVPSLLTELGVSGNKIKLTLDYYHAINYVHKLVDSLPKGYSNKKRKELLKQFTLQLWQGQSVQIADECRALYKRPSQLVKRWIKYLDKHGDKTQYADYQSDRLMCGSGIIESGVRRMINLKFKSPSIF
ncbi:MAG: hypothetical protein AAF573_03300 [Bacteroidota bacterium]